MAAFGFLSPDEFDRFPGKSRAEFPMLLRIQVYAIHIARMNAGAGIEAGKALERGERRDIHAKSQGLLGPS